MIPARLWWRVVSVPLDSSLFQRRAGFDSRSAAFAGLTCPTCHPPSSPSSVRERGKVWPEQLVALATLCATAADWNRNWPIHVSLQAGSGPCLVLTDYLISIQTARVSAPLLRSGKATPDSLFLKAPRALLSSPVSCLNYALFCAVVVFFFLSSSSLASPSFSLSLSPPPIPPSVSHFAVFQRS